MRLGAIPGGLEQRRCEDGEEKASCVCWSLDLLHEVTDRREYTDTGETEQWRSGSQEGIDPLWKDLGGTLRGEV